MSARQRLPEPFNSFTELSADDLGTYVLAASDDGLAAKENLLKPGPAVWLEDEYTDKGKWMDGWETRRRHDPGHDWCLVRLGAPGIVLGAMVDTTHFKGSAPQEASLEGIEAHWSATPAELDAMDGWAEILPQVPIRPDFQNAFLLEEPSDRVTHVRLRIYPDGGVARLRVWGTVGPSPRTFWRAGGVDLAAVENGGTIAAVSDDFFGRAANLLQPGRGANTGDGWHAKRRRGPGSEFAVVRLGRRGVIERVELDTHHFKGDAPQAALLEVLDAEGLPGDELEKLLRDPKGWKVLVDRTRLVPHRRHHLDPIRPLVATHARLQLFPHGGVSRLRLFGQGLETPEEAAALVKLNTMDDRPARALALSVCGSEAWADGFVEQRPYGSMRELFQRAAELWWALPHKSWVEAFAASGRAAPKKKASKGKRQAPRRSPAAELRAKIAKLSLAYQKRLGFPFVLYRAAKSDAEVLEALEARLGRSKAVELEAAAQEQAKISRLRLETWLVDQLG